MTFCRLCARARTLESSATADASVVHTPSFLTRTASRMTSRVRRASRRAEGSPCQLGAGAKRKLQKSVSWETALLLGL